VDHARILADLGGQLLQALEESDSWAGSPSVSGLALEHARRARELALALEVKLAGLGLDRSRTIVAGRPTGAWLLLVDLSEWVLRNRRAGVAAADRAEGWGQDGGPGWRRLTAALTIAPAELGALRALVKGLQAGAAKAVNESGPGSGGHDGPGAIIPTADDLTILAVLAAAGCALTNRRIADEASRWRAKDQAARDAGLVLLSEKKVAARLAVLLGAGAVLRPQGPNGQPTRKKGVGITPEGRSLLSGSSPVLSLLAGNRAETGRKPGG
jgi:hypothetical protein